MRALPLLAVLLASCHQLPMVRDVAEKLRPISMQPDDDDADGVANYADRCRLIRGYAEDGCPLTGTAERSDADLDGVVDRRDRCDDEAGLGPHGCPADAPGFQRTADVAYVLDRVTADYPRAFADVVPVDGATITFPHAAATAVVDGVYVARFGPYATADVARVEYRKLVDQLATMKPSCCALRLTEDTERARWSVVDGEPVFRPLAMTVNVERVSEHHEVALRVGRL